MDCLALDVRCIPIVPGNAEYTQRWSTYLDIKVGAGVDPESNLIACQRELDYPPGRAVRDTYQR